MSTSEVNKPCYTGLFVAVERVRLMGKKNEKQRKMLGK